MGPVCRNSMDEDMLGGRLRVRSGWLDVVGVRVPVDEGDWECD